MCACTSLLDRTDPQSRGILVETYPATDGKVFGVAWVQPDKIALLVRKSDEAGVLSERLLLLETVKGNYTEVPVARTNRCDGGHSAISIGRLPDGRLGYVNRCALVFTQVSARIYGSLLRAIDTESFEDEVLIETGPPFVISELAFSPDMETAFLSRTGANTHKVINLWRQDRGLQGSPSILSTASKSPSWTSSGDRIAYFATRDAGIVNGSFVRADWRLYIERTFPMAAFGTSIEVVDGITSPSDTKWSPDGETLAFSAEVDGAEGVWAYGLSDESLTRVWPRYAHFDWSLDGSGLIIIEDSDFKDPSTWPEPKLVILDDSE